MDTRTRQIDVFFAKARNELVEHHGLNDTETIR